MDRLRAGSPEDRDLTVTTRELDRCRILAEERQPESVAIEGFRAFEIADRDGRSHQRRTEHEFSSSWLVPVRGFGFGDPDLDDAADEIEWDRPARRKADRRLAGEIRRELVAERRDHGLARREQAVVILVCRVRHDELAAP